MITHRMLNPKAGDVWKRVSHHMRRRSSARVMAASRKRVRVMRLGPDGDVQTFTISPTEYRRLAYNTILHGASFYPRKD